MSGSAVPPSRKIVVAIAVAACGLSAASAQGVDATQTQSRFINNLTNKPCLNYESIGRPLSSNPKMVTHIVSVLNRCAKRLITKVCYAKSEQCVEADMPPHGRKDVMIGMFPSATLFRYDYREREN